MSGVGLAVPFVDLSIQQLAVESEVREGHARTIARSSFVMGPEVKKFEEEFAEFCGVKHCLGVGCGTDALELALRAAGIGRSDEVLVPANTFVATAMAVAAVGAVPVAVDVDDDYLLVDPASVLEAWSKRTKAVVAVDLYGQAADCESLREICLTRNAVLLEDAAQAHGARRNGSGVGGLASIAGTSFYPSKNLGAYGDGGAVLTDNPALAERVAALRNYGGVEKNSHERVGRNSRLDSLQAVVLSAKLKHLEAWNDQRREAAAYYHQLLADCDCVRLPEAAPGNEHVWHLYVVRVDDRDAVEQSMRSAGIEVGVHYPKPLHRIPAFAESGGRCSLRVCERACAEVFSLPMFPGITQDQQQRVAEVLRTAVMK